jgi:hypothetical protein
MDNTENEWGMSTPPANTITEENKKKAKINIFDVMASSYDRKKPHATNEEIEALSPYMFARYLSNNPVSVFWANELNNHPDIPKIYQYKFVRISFPKDRIKFIRYIKSEELFDKDIIENACSEYKCGKEVAIRYLEMLPKEEIKKLLAKYDIGGRRK